MNSGMWNNNFIKIKNDIILKNKEQIKLLRFRKQLILRIVEFAFVGDFIISEIEKYHLMVNFSDIQSNLPYLV